MTRVYILRHGNTFDPGDTILRVGALTDLHLSSSGRDQASALAVYFKTTGVSFQAVMCSPLLRARQTLEPIVQMLRYRGGVEITDFLTEIDYGPDEGQPEDDVIARIGAEALNAWEAHSIVPDGWKVDCDGLRSAWREQLSAIAAQYPKGPVLIVTSNGIARFALDIAKNGADWPRKLRTAAFGCLEIGADGAVRVEAWNVRP
ncbi:MAG: histidine phosphatase family protein [Pseudomonadota bacterium]